MSASLNETKYLMKKYKIKANKKLGQNFLVDDNVLNDIVSGAKIEKNDLVIEIGPGLGTLTNLLLEKARKVICIELDKKMIKILKERFIAYNNIEIINQDILKIDLDNLIQEQKNKDNEIKNFKIVANLPYYITTPIIMKLIENNLDIKSITVMIQKEVAERLVALPGTKNAGAITYTVYYYCKTEKIREVENTCFIPAPEVTSEVINLNLRDKAVVEVENKKIFFNIIKSAFMQRRKTVVNALTNVGVFKNKEEGFEYMKKIGVREDARAESLSIEDFANLTNLYINNLLKKGG